MAKLNFLLFVTLFCGLSVNAGIPGGPTLITDETELATLSQRITQHLSNLGGQENTLEFLKLHSAIKKVVAGLHYEFSIEINENKNNVNCTMIMWEKAWENFIKIDVECGEEKRKYKWSTENTSTTSTTELPANPIVFGGYSDLTSEDIKNTHSKLAHSIVEIGKKYNDFQFLLKNIVSGQKQVVSGLHSKMIIAMEHKENKEIKNCEADMIETLNDLLRVEVTCQEKKYSIETTLPKLN